MKKVLGILLVLAIAGGGLAYYLYNKPVESVGGKKPVYTVSSEELLAAYSENEATANEKYLGKVIAVKGNILEIVPGEGLEMQVVLDAGDLMSRVSCVMEEDYESFLARKLKKGDAVTVKGICTGMTMDVVVDRCVVVE